MLLTLVFAFAFALTVSFAVMPKAAQFIWREVKVLLTTGVHHARTVERILVLELALSVGTFLLFKVCLSLFTYFFATDVIEHFLLSRGVFSMDLGQQFALQPKSILVLGGSVLLKFLSCCFIYDQTGRFLSKMGPRHGSPRAFDLGTQILLAFAGVLTFLALEVVFLAQNIATISKYSNLVLLTMANLSLIAFFVCIIHLRYKRDHPEYFVDLQTYVSVDRGLLKVLRSDLFSIGGVLTFAMALHLPHYLGLQFIEDNYVLLLLMVALTLVFILGIFRRFFRQLFDVMTRVFLLPHFGSEPLAASRDWQVPPTLLWVLSAVLGGLILFKSPALLMFFLVIVGLSAISFTIGGIFSSLLLRMFNGLSNGVKHLRQGGGFAMIRASAQQEAVFAVTTLLMAVKVLRPGAIPILLLSLLLIAKPKSYPDTSGAYSQTVLDRDSVILYQNRSSEGYLSVPVSLASVPPHLVHALLLQEDRGLMKQRSWLPNHHNWFGISATAFFRFLTREGGGSNITNQLCKNEAFRGRRVQDVQRKLFELIASFQIAMSMSPEQQLEHYLNRVPMFGGKGHKGVYMASVEAFGRRPAELNALQSLLLVRSLQYGVRFRLLDGSSVSYQDIKEHRTTVREALLARYRLWRDQSMVDEKLIASVQQSELFPTVADPRHRLATSSREFIKKYVPQGATVATTSLSAANQQRMRLAVEQFKARMAHSMSKGPYELHSSALVVEARTGNIIAHHGGEGLSDLSDFGAGFQIGSIMKPFVLLEMLEQGVAGGDLKLYDGSRDGRQTVQNFSRRYSNRYVGIKEMLAKSLNAPFHNISEMQQALPLFKQIERRFEGIGIAADRSVDLDDSLQHDSFLQNYPLGLRRMTLMDVAKAYQVLFNEGLCQWNGLFPSESHVPSSVYSSKSCELVRSALSATLRPGGTGTHFVSLLPMSKDFYAKTGTSDEAIHGWTVLSDGELLVVAFVTYGAVIGERLELNQTPSIPTGSGAQTAGVLAAMVYNHLDNHRRAPSNPDLLASR